jgi:hypothetical protein
LSNVLGFLKNSRFFGSSWIDYKSKKIYLLPTEQPQNINDFEVVSLDDENIDNLNEIFVLDNYKYSGILHKLYKVTLKKTIHQIDNKIKWRVYRRDLFKCFYCGYDQGELTYDHFVPESKGGQTTLENGRSSCRLCNQTKSDSDPEEWLESKELEDIKRKRK